MRFSSGAARHMPSASYALLSFMVIGHWS